MKTTRSNKVGEKEIYIYRERLSTIRSKRGGRLKVGKGNGEIRESKTHDAANSV